MTTLDYPTLQPVADALNSLEDATEGVREALRPLYPDNSLGYGDVEALRVQADHVLRQSERLRAAILALPTPEPEPAHDDLD